MKLLFLDMKWIKNFHLKKIDCSDIKIVENKNIKEVYLSNIYISSWIIDLSAFPNLKYLSINDTFFIKEIILNENVKEIKIHSFDLDILELFDLNKFIKFEYNKQKIK